MKKVDKVPDDAVAIDGYPGYFICRNGDVYSHKERHNRYAGPIKMVPTANRGYLVIGLRKEGVRRQFKLHRLIASAFIPHSEESNFLVRHIDDNGINNDIDNLAWGKEKDNSDDMIRNGNAPKGDKNPSCKTTAVNIKRIRELASDGNLSQSEIGAAYGLTQGHINNVVKRRVWKHI